MKLTAFIARLTLGLILIAAAFGQSTPPAAPALSPAAADLRALVAQVRTKLSAGQTTAEALAPELAQFDALLAKYPERNDDTAQIAVMKAQLYLQVIEDEAKGRAAFEMIKQEFPGTKAAATVDRTLEQIERSKKAKATLGALTGKPAPELNFKWSTKDGLKKLSDLKGQVVVLDFWATWCGPCIASFPQVREHVTHFKGTPVAFLGVTSIQGSVSGLPGGRVDTKGDPAKEMALMHDFIKAKDMTWDVVFSEEEVFNPDYGIQGIPYLAIIAPDGTVRHAGLHPGNKAADISGKIEAILKEFKLATPAAKS